MAITEELSRALGEFDNILMIEDGSGEWDGLTRGFCESAALRETTKKVLILSAADIAPVCHAGCEYRRLDRESQKAIAQLYTMYDFSGRFQVLSDNPQYGGILNYVKTGLMTIEDVFRAVLV